MLTVSYQNLVEISFKLTDFEIPSSKTSWEDLKKFPIEMLGHKNIVFMAIWPILFFGANFNVL